MQRFYALPLISPDGVHRDPKYVGSRSTPTGIVTDWALMDYGLQNTCIVLCKTISPADDTLLRANSDVFGFPVDLAPVITAGDRTLMTTFFEPINVPTDWLTASSTYLSFLRNMAGLFQFEQKYQAISSGHSIFEGGRTLETNWNSLTSQEQTWFLAVSISFGGPSSISGNPKLRTLAKQAGDLWAARSFVLGGVTF